MRRREFLASTLAVGATTATPAGATAASKQYSVTMLPPDRGPGSEVTLEPPLDTTVRFLDKADIEWKYRDILLNFKNENPSVDLTDPNAFLIVAKPRHEPGSYEVADNCVCQCGHVTTNATSCGGGGGGSSGSKVRAQTKAK